MRVLYVCVCVFCMYVWYVYFCYPALGTIIGCVVYHKRTHMHVCITFPAA